MKTVIVSHTNAPTMRTRLFHWSCRHAGILLAGLACALALFFTLPPNAVTRFGWQASSMPAWPYSLITAHLVHLGAVHLAFDLPAALLLGWASDRFGLGRRLLLAALASLVGVDLGLIYGPWTINWYVGLSGVLHGEFAWLTLSLALRPAASRAERIVAVLLCLGGLAKVLIGLSTPVGATDWRGMPLATPVHLYGYGAGLLWAVLRRVK